MASAANDSLHIRVGILLPGEGKKKSHLAFTESLQSMFKDKTTANEEPDSGLEKRD